MHACVQAPPPLPAKKLVDWRHVGALQSAELCNLPPGAAAALIGAARESAVLGDVDAAPAEAWARGSQRVRLQQMVVAVQACLQLARHGLQHAEVAAGGAAQAARQACETARNLFEDVAVMKYSVEQVRLRSSCWYDAIDQRVTCVKLCVAYDSRTTPPQRAMHIAAVEPLLVVRWHC